MIDTYTLIYTILHIKNRPLYQIPRPLNNRKTPDDIPFPFMTKNVIPNKSTHFRMPGYPSDSIHEEYIHPLSTKQLCIRTIFPISSDRSISAPYIHPCSAGTAIYIVHINIHYQIPRPLNNRKTPDDIPFPFMTKNVIPSFAY